MNLNLQPVTSDSRRSGAGSSSNAPRPRGRGFVPRAKHRKQQAHVTANGAAASAASRVTPEATAATAAGASGTTGTRAEDAVADGRRSGGSDGLGIRDPGGSGLGGGGKGIDDTPVVAGDSGRSAGENRASGPDQQTVHKSATDTPTTNRTNAATATSSSSSPAGEAVRTTPSAESHAAGTGSGTSGTSGRPILGPPATAPAPAPAGNDASPHRMHTPPLVVSMPPPASRRGGSLLSSAEGRARPVGALAAVGSTVAGASPGPNAPGPGAARVPKAASSLLRPGASFIARPGSSLLAPRAEASPAASTVGAVGASSPRPTSTSKATAVAGDGASAAKGSARKGKPKSKEIPKELTAEEVATMKIAEFCTSYKSRLPPKPKEKRDKRKAAKAADEARKKRKAASEAAASAPQPQRAMKVKIVDGKVVLDDAAMYVDHSSPFDEDNREEVDEDESTVATASSFTNREIPKRWSPHDTIKFYRGLQRYNTSFSMMVKMFEGERSAKQLKRKYFKEAKCNPAGVARALATPITDDHPFFSENPPPLPTFNDNKLNATTTGKRTIARASGAKRDKNKKRTPDARASSGTAGARNRAAGRKRTPPPAGTANADANQEDASFPPPRGSQQSGAKGGGAPQAAAEEDAVAAAAAAATVTATPSKKKRGRPRSHPQTVGGGPAGAEAETSGGNEDGTGRNPGSREQPSSQGPASDNVPHSAASNTSDKAVDSRPSGEGSGAASGGRLSSPDVSSRSRYTGGCGPPNDGATAAAAAVRTALANANDRRDRDGAGSGGDSPTGPRSVPWRASAAEALER